MSSGDVAIRRESCAVHPDRQAVDRCASCGRTVCLDCAVAFRGQVLCAEDAARELGEPVPPQRKPAPAGMPELASGGLLLVALAATVPPWDRFGPFTGVLSAWRPSPEPWPLFTAIALLVATALAIVPIALGPRRPTRSAAVGYSALAAFATVLGVRVVLGAPDYVSHTPAPYLALGLAGAASLVGAARALRLQ